MRKIIIGLVLSIGLIGCNPQVQTTEHQENKQTEKENKNTSHQEDHTQANKNIVVKVNTDQRQNCRSAKELIQYMYDSQFDLADFTPLSMSQYFDPKLSKLIEKDKHCAEKYGVCNIDFDILMDSQDPEDYRIRIENTQNLNKLRVLIHYGESEKNLIFEMNSEHCPKIKDIHYPRGKSLVEIINS